MSFDIEPYLPLVGVGFSLVSAIAGVKFGKMKSKISDIRKLIESVDEALKDDKITEAEFRGIFSNFKALIKA